MNREEFIQTCVSSGYSSKRAAIKYAGKRDSFTDDDLIGAYRLQEDINNTHSVEGTQKWHNRSDFYCRGFKSTKRFN